MATHNSPKGRPVEVVLGNAGDIEDRGQQIINLGAAMTDASSLLNRLVDNGADMEGSAVDTLREKAGDVNKALADAAGMYVGMGPYIRDYGSALASVKSLMASSVPEANSLWATYQAKVSDWEDARALPTPEPAEDGSVPDDPADEAQGDKDAAYALWKNAGDTYDEHYDRWEDAFDAAVDGIRTADDDWIKDSWKDNLDGFIDFALDVLAVAGLVLAVLALVVGGPIVALLALTVGVLTLVGTLWQYSRGDASLLDVGLAVLGVIPFGAFGEFASGGFKSGMRAWAGFSQGGLSLGDDFARWGLAAGSRSPGQWVGAMRGLGPEAGFVANSFPEIVSAVMSGQDPLMWEVIGQLGTTGEQALYAMGAVGSHYNTIVTAVDGVTGLVDRVADLDPILYPTW
ncbi:hypothetical protein [Microbacterium pumilum]|uniref:WXG100 family type VII secretion target n=1 Tax=Microbacterium pumilum TaxID=344165 RepID=A0ABN2SBF5_9MICO